MGVNYSPRIVTDGLVLCLDAANKKSYPGSGTSWYDLSGNMKNGSLVSTFTFSSNNQGALNFSSSSSTHVRVGPVTSSCSTSITYCLWFNTKSLSSSQTLLWDDDAQSGGDAWININTNGTIQTNRDSDGFGVMVSKTTITTNTWYNLTFVANSTSPNKILYFNGVSDNTNSVLIATRSNRSYVTLGANFDGGTYPGGANYFNGYMSHVSIYNRALSAEEISQNFNALRGRYGL